MAERRRAAVKKYWAVAPRIMALPGPVVVFSAHREPIEALRGEGWPVILGDTGKSKRAEIIREFQEGRHVGVGITTAANEGVTLTRATTMIRIDLCWTVSGNMQAEDRILRIGQDKPVTIIDVVGTGVDRKVYEVLRRKQEIMEGLDLI